MEYIAGRMRWYEITNEDNNVHNMRNDMILTCLNSFILFFINLLNLLILLYTIVITVKYEKKKKILFQLQTNTTN